MSPLKLTSSLVESLAVGAKDKFVFDSVVPGFGVRISPRGARTYFAQYRVGTGRGAVKKRKAIGSAKLFSAERARQKARDWIAMARGKKDPAQEVTVPEKHSGSTMTTLFERYLKEYAERHLKPGSVKNLKIAFRKHVLPEVGGKHAAEVTRVDIANVHRKMSKTPAAANGMLLAVSGLYGWLQDEMLVPEGTNPARSRGRRGRRRGGAGIVKYDIRKRTRYLSEAEMGRLGAAISKLRPKYPAACAVIEALALSGWRRNEMAALPLSSLDRHLRVANLGDSKTGAAVRHISPEVTAIIDGVERPKKHPYCFPGLFSSEPIRKLERPWREIKETAGLGPDVKIHSLRHGFASHALNSGEDFMTVKRILGHAVNDVTAGYAHSSHKALQAANDRISGMLREMLDRREDVGPNDVFEFAAAAD